MFKNLEDNSHSFDYNADFKQGPKRVACTGPDCPICRLITKAQDES